VHVSGVTLYQYIMHDQLLLRSCESAHAMEFSHFGGGGDGAGGGGGDGGGDGGGGGAGGGGIGAFLLQATQLTL
jgi:hypothetical protein